MSSILLPTKFHGPTNTRGSRISATDEDGNRITVSCNHALNHDGNHDAAAIALCVKMHWDGVLVRGGLGNSNVYVFLDDSAIVHIPQLPTSPLNAIEEVA